MTETEAAEEEEEVKKAEGGRPLELEKEGGAARIGNQRVEDVARTSQSSRGPWARGAM